MEKSHESPATLISGKAYYIQLPLYKEEKTYGSVHLQPVPNERLRNHPGKEKPLISGTSGYILASFLYGFVTR
jgi:hypothetical protein